MAVIEYRQVRAEDIEYVAKRMRKADVAEASALGMTPLKALQYSVSQSDEAFAAWVDGEVSMIFGYLGYPLKEEGDIWALGTDKMFTVPRVMLTEGRRVVDAFLNCCPALGNWIGAENIHSITWLKHLGFTISEPEPHGLHGEMFRKIGIKRKEK